MDRNELIIELTKHRNNDVRILTEVPNEDDESIVVDNVYWKIEGVHYNSMSDVIEIVVREID